MAAPEPATARLQRLLTLVPWLQNRPGIGIDEAAAGLGITPEQLQEDLNLIWMCGYGQLPDELIDVDAEGGRIVVSNADVIARPLRLNRDEAITLIVGLRALADAPGLTDTDAIERALAKLEDATGNVGDVTRQVRVALGDGSDATVLATIRQAYAERKRLHLRYLVPARDEVTERDVDPMRVVNLDANWYLEGYCHRAEDVRLFRVDRIESATILEVGGTPPAQARPRDLGEGVYVPTADDLQVRLRLRPGARWVRDYYPVSDVTEGEDGTLEVTMSAGDPAFVQRLVLRLGGGAVVLDPPWLAANVRRSAQTALSAYAQEG